MIENRFLKIIPWIAVSILGSVAVLANAGPSQQDGVAIDGATKIDDETCLGLNGVSNSLCYRVMEIERHFHGRERWYGKTAVQTATDWGDLNTLTPFRAISGLNTWGADVSDEALVLGTDDTPAIGGMTKFDLHRVKIVAASSATIYMVRLVYGTGTMADAILAGQYSSFMVKIDPAIGETPAEPINVMMPRGTAGSTQIWVQAWNVTNDATIDFVVGVHEYEG